MEGVASSCSAMEVKEDNTRLIIDIDHSSTNSLRQELSALQHRQLSFKNFSICRIPPIIQQGGEKYYEPSLVSIGPYHHGRKHLQPMESYKLQSLNDFLARNTKNSLEDYVNSLREVEGRARSCYFEHIDLTSEEFVKMLLLNGCFILEVFLPGDDDDGDGSWLEYCLANDIFLLENQIPFFVINILFNLLVQDIEVVKEDDRSKYDLGIVRIILSDTPLSLKLNTNVDDIHHILNILFLVDSHTTDGNAGKKNDIVDGRTFVGLLICLLKPLWLAILYICHALSWRNKQTSSEKATTIPSSSKLVENRIKIKKRIGDYTAIDIVYKDGVLEIPPNIKIGEEHKCLLFNLLAFEQYNISDLQKMKLSTYFQFMDLLIDTPNDVELLQERGIIISYLKSPEDTDLFFNELNHHVYIDREDHRLVPLYTEINKFCNSKWHKYRAKLKRDYFSNSWSIISLIAAIILLILTFVQTYFAWYGYINPPS